MWLCCEERWLTTSCDVRGASNGLLVCESCRTYLADSDLRKFSRLVIFVPCRPLLTYVEHVLERLCDEKDKAGRMRTVDEILHDLENDQTSTPERRVASPFLHCLELASLHNDHPQGRRSQIPVYTRPPSITSNGQSYHIIDVSNPDTDSKAHMDISLFAPMVDDNTVLWRIRRSAGLFLGCVDFLCPTAAGNRDLQRAYRRVLASASAKRRGLGWLDLAHDEAISEQIWNALEDVENATAEESDHDEPTLFGHRTGSKTGSKTRLVWRLVEVSDSGGSESTVPRVPDPKP
ncbi:unnamed protein product [Peniophora sp. CBMAI 1063]|nr:unnamed protein product [Peniophora sp. CBMAI 1063]